MYDGSDYYLFEELFLRMIGICFIHCHNEQADECLYHLSLCTQDFFYLDKKVKIAKKAILAENQVMENIWQPNWTHRLTSNPSSNKDEKDLGYIYKDNIFHRKP